MDGVNSGLIYDSISEKIISIAEKLATGEGAHNVTVKKITSELGATNRVFYNRFHGVDEVLEIVYKKAVLRMHESVKSDYDINTEFFEYVLDVTEKVLINTYNIKKEFNQYMFSHDSLTESNYKWWVCEIKKIIKIGKENKQIKDVDPDMLSYAVWCFCRGYNADAVSRNISKEEALKNFRFGFGCLLDGIRYKPE